MILKSIYLRKTLLLIFIGCLGIVENTFAVITTSIPLQQETTLDKKDFIKALENTKGQKLSFFETIGAKLFFKRANKKKDTSSKGKKDGMAIASLQLGILSLLGYLGTMSILGALVIPAAILAIVFGVLAKKKAKQQPDIYGGHGMALAGMICGIVSLSVIVIALIIIISLLASF